MIIFFMALFNFEVIDELLLLFEFFLRKMIFINILVNFESTNKNYFLINKIKN